MNCNDQAGISGRFHIVLKGPDGQIKEERDIKNVITTAGKTFLATWLATASQAAPWMNYIGIGTGTTAVAASDTILETELIRKAATITSSLNVWQSQVVFNAGEGTGSITESGVLSTAVAGTLMSHQTFAVVNKGALDSLQITWAITFA
jgi:hypothetical protein